MSIVFDRSESTFLAGFARTGLKVASRLADMISKRIANRAAIRQLAEADEFMLRDIGLSRSDVNAALRAPLLSDPIEHMRVFSETPHR